MDIKTTVSLQQNYFLRNNTKPIDVRIQHLKKLKQLFKENEAILYDAIYADFGKSEFDTYLSELSIIYTETDAFIKKIKKWSKPKRVSTGLANFPARSYIIPEPLGTVLVIGAWNYPYQLSLLPAISALAAGNTVIIKPSELPNKTSQAMAQLINGNFDPAYFHVIEGGVETTTELLAQKFDKIFFTGSIPVGKIVYQAAAKNLTPVTLELGGKSPAFVFADADLKMTAKRLVWAKFFNAGQTCVAPDYLLVEKSIEKPLLSALKAEIEERYPKSEQLASNYTQIIDAKNFDRLRQLIEKENVFCGGETNSESRIIFPTILQNTKFSDKIMEDEIFGPLLPIISFTKLDAVIVEVKKRPKPLSCYIYSKNKKTIKKLLHEISFGGGAINDSIMHLSNMKMPFGGVGASGFGAYHGKYGFDCFSHQKSILHKTFLFELDVKYAPYTAFKLKLVKWLMG